MAEKRRLEAEREERERRRQESELQAIKDRNFKEKMQQISQTAHGQKVLKKLNEDVSILKKIRLMFLYCMLFIFNSLVLLACLPTDHLLKFYIYIICPI